MSFLTGSLALQSQVPTSELEVVHCSWVLSQAAWFGKAKLPSLAPGRSVQLLVYSWVACVHHSRVPSHGLDFCKAASLGGWWAQEALILEVGGCGQPINSGLD